MQPEDTDTENEPTADLNKQTADLNKHTAATDVTNTEILAVRQAPCSKVEDLVFFTRSVIESNIKMLTKDPWEHNALCKHIAFQNEAIHTHTHNSSFSYRPTEADIFELCAKS